ncbi:PleD family two-component system response regulator [Patescibacteria group bacterium]
MAFFENKKDKEKKRILIIEDDALLAKVLINSSEAEGFDALNIKDGLQVIETAKKYNPHIILLDLILPGLDGFEVLKRLKADAQIGKIPVFVLSNLDGISDIKSIKALGAEQYFLKAETRVENIINSVKKRIE